MKFYWLGANLIFALFFAGVINAQAATCPTDNGGGIGCSNPALPYYCNSACRSIAGPPSLAHCSDYVVNSCVQSGGCTNAATTDCGFTKTCVGGYSACTAWPNTTCKANVSVPANCKTFVQCTETCTACNDGYELDVNGICQGAAIRLDSSSVASDRLKNSINVSPSMSIFGSGNVAIGTTSALYRLFVAGNTAMFDYPVFVGAPTADGHAATKNYVDSALSLGGGAFWSGTSTGDIWNLNSGGIGVGTTTAAGEKLAITGGRLATLGAYNMYSGGQIFSAGTGANAFAGKLAIGQIGAASPTFYVNGGAGIGTTYSSFNIATSTLAVEGNIGIGITNPGAKLDVFGDSFLNGSVGVGVAPSSTLRLIVRSTAANPDVPVALFQNSNGTNVISLSSSGHASFFNPINIGSTAYQTNFSVAANSNVAATSGVTGGVSVGNFIPPSGTATFSAYSFTSTINQSGGANGITRGVHINPTLTSAVDFRGVETNVAAGTGRWNFYAAGAASSYFNGSVGIGTTNTVYAKLNLAKDITSNGLNGFYQLILTGSTNPAQVMGLGYDTTSNFGYINAGIQGSSYSPIILNAGGGNVGIGTTTANAKLTVSGGNIFINDAAITSGTPKAAITKEYLDAALLTATSSLINLWGGAVAGNAWSLSSGNIGIGLTAPTQKLHVSGSIYTTNNLFMNTSGGSTGISWYTPSYYTWFDYMKQGGAVSTPNGLAAASDTASGVTGWARRFNIESGGSYGWLFESGSNSTSSAPTVKFAINAASGTFHSTGNALIDGNVGIGTTSPTTKLSVSHTGSTGVVGTMTFANTNNDYTRLQVLSNGAGFTLSGHSGGGGYISATGGLNFSNNDAANAGTMWLGNGNRLRLVNNTATETYFLINNIGNVGIGTTTPATRLTVAGSGNYSIDATNFRIGNVAAPVQALDAVNKSYMDSALSAATSSIATLWGGTTGGNVWALNSGNVGVGITNPSFKFQVTGNSRFSDTVTVNNGVKYASSSAVYFENIALKNNGSIPNGFIKLVTPIRTSDNQMFSIDITGYDYNTGKSIDFTVVGYAYAGTDSIINLGYSNRSSFNREVRATLEDRGNGYRVLVIALGASDVDGNSNEAWYYQKFGATVRLWAGASDTFTADQFTWVNGETTLAAGHFKSGNLNNQRLDGALGTIITSGNVGIGTTTAATRLTITGSGNYSIDTGNFRIGNVAAPVQPLDAVNKSYLDSAILAATSSISTLWGGTTGGNVWSLNSGNVGIGTTTPNSKLHILGSVKIDSANPVIDLIDSNGADWKLSLQDNHLSFLGNDGVTEYVRFNNGGNIGLGTTGPEVKLDVYDGAIANRTASGNHYRNVLTKYIGNGAQTGTLEVVLPKFTDTMLDLTFKGYDWSTASAWEARVSGYVYVTSNGWYGGNYEVQLIGGAPFTQVRLGYNGTRPVILFGNTSTVWTYSSFEIADVSASYSNFNGWGTGWTAALITDETGRTINATPAIHTYTTPTGNFGIGTTTPATRLTVVGSGNYSIDATNFRIGNVAAPVQPLDAVNKSYMDSALSAATSSISTLWGGTTNGNIWSLNSGNVGIGTTSPSSLFNAVSGVSDFRFSTGASAVTPTMAVINANAGGKAAALLAGTSGSAFAFDNSGTFSIMAESKSAFTGNSLGTGATLMRVLANGNVGINTTNPFTKLEISNQAAFNPVTPGTGYYGFHFNGQTTADYASGITWNGAGGNNAEAGLYVQGSGVYGTKMYFATTDDYGIGAKTRMMIDHVGNVGIGTTTPDTRLTVVGSGNYSIDATNFRIGNVAAPVQPLDAVNKSYMDSALSAATSSISTLWGGTTGGNVWALNSGNVGIGITNPGAKLDVNGSIMIQDGNELYLSGSGSRKPIRLYASPDNEKGVIDIERDGVVNVRLSSNGNSYFNSVGNVGIGTTAPVGKLDVSPGGVVTAGDLVVDTANRTLYVGRLSPTGGDNTNFVFRDRIGGVKSYWENASSGSISFGNFGTNYGVSIATSALGAGATTTARLAVDSGSAAFPSAVFTTGNVGIGTTTPDTRLTVVGSGNYSIDATNFRIGNVATPVQPLDAVNKSYMDSALSAATSSISALWGGTTGGNVWALNSGSVGIGNTNPVAKMHLGSGTPSHAVAVERQLYVSSDAEFDGYTYFDGPVYFNAADLSIMPHLYFSEEGSELKYASDYNAVFTTGSNRHLNFDHAAPTTPTIYIQSALSPDVSNNEWVSFTHDANNFKITTGANTGVGSAPATVDNGIIFSPRGTEAMRIIGNGNVGIGTSTPDAKLAVNNGNIFINDAAITSGTPKAAITKDYLDSALSSLGGGTSLWNINGSKVYASSTSWMVGIGTTNPTNLLQVRGALSGTGSVDVARFDGGSTVASGGLVFTSYYDAAAPSTRLAGIQSMDRDGNYKNLLLNLNGGNVGVGLNAPDAALHVVSGASDNRIVSFGYNATIPRFTVENSSYNARLRMWNSSALTYASQEQVLINTSGDSFFNGGNVGISTTTPDARLSVHGGNIFIDDASITAGTPKAAITKEYLDSALSSLGSVTSLWNLNGSTIYASSTSWMVGIGTTTPDSMLHIAAATAGDGGTNNGSGALLHLKQLSTWTGSQQWALFVEGYSYLNGFRINGMDTTRSLFQTRSTYPLGFATAGDKEITFTQSTNVERMRIAAGGNVGIGTTTPDAKLAVNGGNIFINDAAITSGTPKAAITKDYLDSALSSLGSGTSLWNYNGSTIYASSTDWSVGIGVTNPLHPLEVKTAATGAYTPLAGFFAPANTTAGYASQIRFGQSDSAGNAAEWRFVYQGSNNALNRLDFGWDGYAAPVISYLVNGNVGIGNTAPTNTTGSGRVLHLSDTVGYTQVLAENKSTTGGAFFAQKNDTGKQLSYVTFGSANPNGALFGVTRPNNSFMYTYTGGALTLGTLGPDNLTLGTNSVGNMTIKSGGYIGIGTSSPDTDKIVTVVGGNMILKDAIISAGSDAKLVITKGYLDSVIDALPSSGGLSTYATATPSAYNGARGGYSSANALCNATVTGTHVCTSEEILNTINSGGSLPPSTTLWINSGPPGYTVNANDCIGWTNADSSSYSTIWVKLATGDGFGALEHCNNTRRYACCQ